MKWERQGITAWVRARSISHLVCKLMQLVAIVPVTVLSTGMKRQAGTDVPFHPSFKGTVLFKNTFDGQLPAADYPKKNVSVN